MAIEDQIAAGVRPPQVDTLTEAAQHAYTLRNLGLETQQRQLQIQQQQQDQAEQQQWSTIYRNAKGQLSVAIPAAQAAGISMRTLGPIQKAQADMQEQLSKVDETKLKNDGIRGDQTAGQIAAFDQNPDAYKQANYPAFLAGLRRTGHLTDDEYGRMPQQYPGAEGMQTIAAHYLTYSEQSKIASERSLQRFHNTQADDQAAEEKRKEQLFPAQLDKSQADAREQKSKADQEAIKAQQLSALGMTQHDRESLDETQRRDRATAAYQFTLGNISAGRLSVEQQRLANETNGDGSGNGQTANSKHIDIRALNTSVSKAQADELKMNSLRGQLGASIATGATFVDRNGQVKSMQAASGGDAATKAALIEDMTQRYRANSTALKQTIADKNAKLAQLGSPGTVSTEQAHAAIDAGDAKLFGTQPPATPAKGARQLTDRSIAAQYLQKAGGDRAKARQMAAADGWKF